MLLKSVSRLVFAIQTRLFPALEESIGPLSAQDQQLVKVCELLKLEELLRSQEWKGVGRPPESRLRMAYAFVAKAQRNIPNTDSLIAQLRSNPSLRHVCGWHDGPSSIPDKSTFSRAFATFAELELTQRAHAALVSSHLGKERIEHASTDSTAIEARERVTKDQEPCVAAGSIVAEEVSAPASPPPPKRKRGRPRKDAPPPEPPPPKRLERHLEHDLASNLIDMPKVQCAHGCKTNAKGYTDHWIGYKLHIVTGDGDIPLVSYLSSASMHDSQAAIVLEQMLVERTGQVFYHLRDSAYDAQTITAHSSKQGIVPITQKRDYRSCDAVPMEPDRARRFRARSSSERVNSDLKDNHGGRTLRVRGAAKVATHLMFGVLVMTAEALIRLAT